MKKQVVIKIVGTQTIDGESDSIEVLTTGSFYKKNGIYYISYQEEKEYGAEQIRTTIKVEDTDKITMIRNDDYKSPLIVEKQVRHSCAYDVGGGHLMIGVWGNSILSDLTDEGGRLNFKYTMDINTALASENEVTINIEECVN